MFILSNILCWGWWWIRPPGIEPGTIWSLLQTTVRCSTNWAIAGTAGNYFSYQMSSKPVSLNTHIFWSPMCILLFNAIVGPCASAQFGRMVRFGLCNFLILEMFEFEIEYSRQWYSVWMIVKSRWQGLIIVWLIWEGLAVKCDCLDGTIIKKWDRLVVKRCEW